MESWRDAAMDDLLVKILCSFVFFFFSFSFKIFSNIVSKFVLIASGNLWGTNAVYSFSIVVARRVVAVAGGRHGGRELKGMDWIGCNNSSLFAIQGCYFIGNEEDGEYVKK